MFLICSELPVRLSGRAKDRVPSTRVQSCSGQCLWPELPGRGRHSPRPALGWRQTSADHAHQDLGGADRIAGEQKLHQSCRRIYTTRSCPKILYPRMQTPYSLILAQLLSTDRAPIHPDLPHFAMLPIGTLVSVAGTRWTIES